MKGGGKGALTLPEEACVLFRYATSFDRNRAQRRRESGRGERGIERKRERKREKIEGEREREREREKERDSERERA